MKAVRKSGYRHAEMQNEYGELWRQIGRVVLFLFGCRRFRLNDDNKFHCRIGKFCVRFQNGCLLNLRGLSGGYAGLANYFVLDVAERFQFFGPGVF